MAHAPEQTLKAGSRVGGYEIVRVIGAGGFGITYEGFNPITRNRAAVKEFFPRGIVSRAAQTIVVNDARDRDLFDKVLKKFEETTTELAALRHPNIVRVYDYIPGNQTGYMMMEFIEGDSVRDVLDRSAAKTLASEAEFRRIFAPILDAIRYVHSKNLIHRDISPDNIMITKDGRPVLIDFGALRRQLDGNRVSTLMVARDKYAPPEQGLVEGLPHGYYTDIFALGATMYEALAGDPPIRAGNRIWAKQDPYVALARAAKVRCRPEVFTAIDQALRTRSEERPQTMDQFIGLLGWSAQPAAARPGAAQGLAPPTQLVPGGAAPATQLVQPAHAQAALATPPPLAARREAAPVAPFAGSPGGGPAIPAQAIALPQFEAPRRSPALGILVAVGAAALSVYFLVAQSRGIFPFTRASVPSAPSQPTTPATRPSTSNLAQAREEARACLLRDPCDPAPCIPPALGQWPNSPELGELKDFVRDRCRVPNGVYSGEYAFTTANSATCPQTARINEIFVSKDSISFTLNNVAWRGTINQKSGLIDIKWDNIKPKPENETYVRGPFSNATFFDARCGEGQFKLHLRR